MEITAQDLSRDAFAPYGEMLDSPGREPDAAGPGWLWWAETALLPADARPYGIGYLSLAPASPCFDWAERHLKTVEMLTPVGGDCLVYVGPPDLSEQPDLDPELETFQVFRVRQGQAVILKPGVWHGAPLALDRNLSVLVVLLQNTGRDDTRVARFPETPVTIRP